jgi:hypothetical protein
MRSAMLRTYVRKEFLRYGIHANVTQADKATDNAVFLTPRIAGRNLNEKPQIIGITDPCVRVGDLYVIAYTGSLYMLGIESNYHAALVPPEKKHAVPGIEFNNVHDVVAGLLDDIWCVHVCSMYQPSKMQPSGFALVNTSMRETHARHQWMTALGRTCTNIMDYNAWEAQALQDHRNRIHALEVTFLERIERVKQQLGVSG